MPRPPLVLSPPPDAPDADARIRDGLAELRDRLALPREFPPQVLAAAEVSARRDGLAEDHDAGRVRSDLTDVDFVTIDPPGSTDLDQALHIERRTGPAGFRVRYAIADVAAFVTVGDPVESESRLRGVTIYLPDGRVPLHPPVLSEHAASLRAGQVRPAVVWDMVLDGDGTVTDARLERAVVRSRAELDYPSVQRSLDDGTGGEGSGVLDLLREVGRLRKEQAAARGAVSLPLPDQEVVTGPDGHLGLAYRAPLPVEDWNAQISLMAGMAAARIMLDAGLGVLRTLPPPTESTLAGLRATAAALGIPWAPGSTYVEVVGSLDPTRAADAAFATQAARLFRGAGYAAFDERSGPPPSGTAAEHAAVAAPYAHVTAPLRRLVDRIGNEVVLAHCDGRTVPDGVRTALSLMPDLMEQARRRESQADSGARDLVEQVLLSEQAGRPLAAVVVGVDERGVRLQLRDPAVLGRLDVVDPSRYRLGQEISVTSDGSGVLSQSEP